MSDIHGVYYCSFMYALTIPISALYCLTFIGLLLCLPHCIVWHSLYCSVYPIVMSDIHFTALFTSYCNIHCTVWHCNVWHSFYCSVYPIVCLTFILLCLPHCKIWHSFTAGVHCIVWHSLYCSVYPIVMWHSFYCSVYPIVMSDIHCTALFTPL